MQRQNPIMMLFPLETARRLSGPILKIGTFLSKLIFSIKYDLQKAEIDVPPEVYCTASFLSAIVYAFMFLFVGMAFGIIITKGIGIETIGIMIIFSIMAFFSSLAFHLFYPKIASMQLAGMVEQDLLFALRTMLLQLSSGVSLFETIKSISRSNYGQVSSEFEMVIKDINSGVSESVALEKLAFRTRSEILKKTIWQLVTTMKSGGSVTTAINAQVDSLVEQQKESIKRYSAELNLWTLVYLIIAAAMPSLGVTFLVIASSIGGSGIGKEAVILIAFLAFAVQIAMILLVRSKVPRVIK